MSVTSPAETVPPTFSGFRWEPSNEQQVVLLFGMLLALKQFEEPLCIETCDTTFPDCIAMVLNSLPSDRRSESDAPARFDWRAAGLSIKQRTVLTLLRRFGESRDSSGFSISWPKSDDSVKFSITCQSHGGIGFGASAKGTVGVPFSKWRGVSRDVKVLVIEKLNTALPHLDFTHHARKKKGYDVDVLLPDTHAVERFLQVWRDVVAELNARS